jgi:putative sterol carrier protein
MPEIATSVKDVFEQHLPSRLQAKPDVVAKINAVYQFSISGPDGGTWTVDCTAPGGKVSSGPSPAARCTVTATDKDLLSIVNGKLNPQMAFMSGKLRIAGDIGLAMKLQLILT